MSHPLLPGESPPSGSQFSLLRQRRFGPFFITQLLGAANDNLFKFALTVLVTYQVQVSWLPPQLAGLVIGALFILPFVLFSATAGQWADKLDKAWLMRQIKLLEVFIMSLAALGFGLESVPLLLLCIALMGLHSTLFGPVKYAYLPQHLGHAELTRGNGLVEMGTFVAILLGNVGGGLLMSLPHGGPGTGGNVAGVNWGARSVSVCCLVVAVLGLWAARRIPASPSSHPHLPINRNPLSETWRNLKLARQDPTVFLALLGISWLWFFGAVFLSQFPAFARLVVGGDEQVASLLLVVFSLGIAAGALCCEGLSREQVDLGLVPVGALGMTVFGLDLWRCSQALAHSPVLVGVPGFVQEAAHWRLMLDLALLSFSAGLYSVPLYALIQWRALPSHRARIIAANNILNALFMVVSSVAAGALLGAGFSVPQVFGLTAALNGLVGACLVWRMPACRQRWMALWR